MQRYLDQLHTDIMQAIGNAPDRSLRALLSADLEPDDVWSDEQLLQTKRLRPADIFGLDPHAFPPASRLNKAQTEALLADIEQLWQAWNLSWECPPGLPAERRYHVMVHLMLHETIAYHPQSGGYIDFCARRKEGQCPFGSENTCFCQRNEQTAISTLLYWEHWLDRGPNTETTPIDELYEWLQDELPPNFWESFHERTRWQQFITEEDMLSWLYFYRPENRSMLDDNAAEDNAENGEQNTGNGGLEWEDGGDDPDFDIEFPY